MPRYAITYIFEADDWDQAVKLSSYAEIELSTSDTPFFAELSEDARQ